jgi:hypothetical protein
MRSLSLVTFVLLVSLSGCHRVPPLVPRLIAQGEPVGDDFWLAAPYILVVKIVDEEWEGGRQAIFPGGEKVLQLVKFTANVENSIQGNLPQKTITFYFFAKIDTSPYYLLNPGERYIISLRREGAILRSWADGSQLKIWLHSGSHSQNELPLERGVRRTIAYIIMTPGADCDPSAFASDLLAPTYVWEDPAYMNQLLHKLETHPNRKIRELACIESAMNFGYRPKCLEQARNSPDSYIRERAETYLKEDSHLGKLLKSNPAGLFSRNWTDYMSGMYEIYTEDIRPDIRKDACRHWLDLAPRQASQHCQ